MKIFEVTKVIVEGYKLQLERDTDMMVLHIKDTATGKRTEVRGKPGYETNYDPNDSLHILLDKVGKSANISDLMNGEVVSINPNHPDATKAKAATDVAYNEALDQPYPVRWSIQDDDEWEGKAKTEAGDSIQIMITQGHNNHKWEIDFYVGGSMQVTGKGDQFRVFATVVSAVKKWWAWLSKSKQPVEAIIFSAFKGNKSAKGSAGRSSLYNRFANQFARSIGFNVSTVDGSDNIKFMLTNPNYKDQQAENFADSKINEALDNPYPINWVRLGQHGDSKANVKLPDGSLLEIEFYLFDTGMFDIIFKRGRRLTATGSGDEFRIFATVKSAIVQWWKQLDKEGINQVTFSAAKADTDDDSKRRYILYKRFAKQFAQQSGWGLDTEEDNKQVNFILKNPNPVNHDDIDENLKEEKYTTAFLKKLIAKAEAMADKDFSQYTPADHAFMDKFFGYHLPNMINQFGDMAGVVQPLLQSKYYTENFADGKKKGKSRPGRVKRAGASCNGSVTDLRKRAKNASGEKAKMYHWCANMKSGRKKK